MAGQTQSSPRRAWGERLHAALADEHCFWKLFTCVAAIISILKGLRFPISWAFSQAQSDYREGFLKRALFGEIFRRSHIPIFHYRLFTGISFLLLAAFLLLFLRFVRSSGLMEREHGPLLTLIAASYTLSYFVSMIGYLDVLLAIFALLVLSLRPGLAQLVAVAATGCIAVLFHEMYAIVFLPLTLVPYLLRYEDHADRTRHWLSAAVAFLVPWITVAALTLHRALTTDQIARLESGLLGRVDASVEPRFFEIYSRSAAGNMRLMFHDYISTGSWHVLQLLAVLAFFPAAALFLTLSFKLLEHQSRMLKLYLLGAVAAPLSMNLLGYDIFRWAALMGLNAMLVFLLVLRAQPTRERLPALLQSAAVRHVAILLIAVNLATNIGMFMRGGKDFPFYDYWSDFVIAKHSHGRWIHPYDSH